jgi:hypothetical protein
MRNPASDVDQLSKPIGLRSDVDDLRIYLLMLELGEIMDHRSERFLDLDWIAPDAGSPTGYTLTPAGMRACSF